MRKEAIMGTQFLFIVFLTTLLVNQSNCLRCYACGEPNTFLGENYTKVMPCRDFDEATDPEAVKRFVIECPSEYVGCITQKQGGQVMRTCDTFAFEECQTANGVTYCYCNHDLCNGKLPQNQPRVEESQHDLSDDEDYSEMSGFGEDGNIKEGSNEMGFQANDTKNEINSTREASVTGETSTKYHSSSSRFKITFSLVLFLHVVVNRL